MRVTHFSLSRENRKKGELQVKQAEEKKGEDKLFGAFSFSPFPSCFWRKHVWRKEKKNEREYETRIGVAEKSSNVLVFYVLLTQKKKEAKQQKKKGFQSRRGLAIITQ